MNTRVLRLLPYPAVLLAALGGVYLATREGSAATDAPTAHDHAAPRASDSVARPVSLSEADARRIGVTFAPVTLGALSREVRVVGQITFDETRVRAIAPKVDGWVDRLYVNSTGQPVAAGQPLLTIHSPMLVMAQEELLLALRLQGDMAGADGTATQRTSELVASARRRLSYWDISDREIAEIERSGAVRRTLTLRASLGGYVLEKNVLAGQKIMAGEALYRVADLGTVWVEGEVFEQDLASVHQGQTVRAELRRCRASPARAASRTSIPPSTPTRAPYAFASCSRTTISGSSRGCTPRSASPPARATTCSRVPRSAVLSTGERSIVFVREASGALTPREVALGASNDERIEILRGCRAGEMVVASATFLVDAESNLGTALGGMGDMPGMELTTPPRPLDTPATDRSSHGSAAKP